MSRIKIVVLVCLAVITAYLSSCGFCGCENGTGAACNANLAKNAPAGHTGPRYTADWESLAKHQEAPEWFQDAKIGIYFHWGVYSVPAFGSEWYPRHMHFSDTKEFTHHEKTYGKPSEFGYHDFVPMFKAEHFDANQWAELFRKAGAKFAGPVAEHHDGFSMWDSEITPWNSMDKGPGKDITGELAEALRKRDMKLITTFHHARNLQRYTHEEAKKEISSKRTFHSSHYPLFENMPPASDDPELKMLYGNMPAAEWEDKVWLGKLKEVINKYQPDIIWFDSWLDKIPEQKRKEFCAYYLNQADKWGKDVVIIRKQKDLPLEVSINDHEKSRESRMSKHVWMTDDTISTGSWCYTGDLKIKPADTVLYAMIDTVSKNGVVLLNLSPKADGSIPDDQKKTLTEVGAWLKTNGESIYATRPWLTFGEGPVKEPKGGFGARKEFMNLKYSAKDIRFTQSKDGKTIYAIVMGDPGEGNNLLIESFANEPKAKNIKVKKVTLISTGKKVDWQSTPQGLKLTMPKADTDMAYAFKIELK